MRESWGHVLQLNIQNYIAIMIRLRTTNDSLGWHLKSPKLLLSCFGSHFLSIWTPHCVIPKLQFRRSEVNFIFLSWILRENNYLIGLNKQRKHGKNEHKTTAIYMLCSKDGYLETSSSLPDSSYFQTVTVSNLNPLISIIYN